MKLNLDYDFVRCLRRAAGSVALSLILFASPAHAGQGAIGDSPAVPPGQEALLLKMLGMDAMLPGCDLVDGQIEHTVVTVSYACLDGEVEYQLKHRSQAGAQATVTDQFAITLTNGKPPRGFSDALIALIRSRETDFEWVWLDGSPE